MSEAQLKKLIVINDQLKAQLDRLPKCLKTSESCRELVAFTSSKPDPFLPDFAQPNPFHSGGSGACSLV